jgi:putative hydrolase of the HAD superfamily
MKTYQHIFFDLDHTLWDFDTNAKETLEELYLQHNLKTRNVPDAASFINTYKEINEACWALYRRNEMTKDVLRTIRFRKTLEHFGTKDETLSDRIGDDYVAACPLKTNVIPGTYELLDYLKGKYPLHIITNGFEEIQDIKMRESRLTHYFQHRITSEQVGHKKPDARVFTHALEVTGAQLSESLMIGDSLEADVLGAKAFGMDQVYFNPESVTHNETVTHEISELIELKSIL